MEESIEEGVYVKVAFIYHCDDFIKEIQAVIGTEHKVRIFHWDKPVKFYNMPYIIGKIKALMAWSDTCFFEWSAFLLAVASKLRKPRNTKIITRLHKFEINSWSHRINWDFVDKIIFVSDAIKQRFIRQMNGKVPTYKMHVIRNFVNTLKWQGIERTGKPSFLISMVGSVHPNKRIYDVMLAMRELIKVIPELKLNIIGDFETDYGKDLHNARHYLGLVDCVRFFPHMTLTQLKISYFASDIVICNSVSEAFNYVLQEAMLCGCEVFSHNWDGVHEFIQHSKIYTSQTEMITKIIRFYELTDTQRQYLSETNRTMANNENNILGNETIKQINELIK